MSGARCLLGWKSATAARSQLQHPSEGCPGNFGVPVADAPNLDRGLARKSCVAMTHRHRKWSRPNCKDYRKGSRYRTALPPRSCDEVHLLRLPAPQFELSAFERFRTRRVRDL